MIAKKPARTQLYDEQSQVFKLLTHPVRLAILDILREGEHCVCHMEAHLGYRQAYISQQVAVLREAGLIQDRRDGWNIFYHVCEPSVFEVLDSVQKMLGQERGQPVDTAKVACPCPKCNPQ